MHLGNDSLSMDAVSKTEAAIITLRIQLDTTGVAQDFTILSVNEPALRILKKKYEEVINQLASSVFNSLCNAALLEAALEVFRSGTVKEIDAECGTMLSSGGGIDRYHITIFKTDNDVNLMFERIQKRKDEDLLSELELNTKEIFENIPIGAYLTSSDGRILFANQLLISMLGYESFSELARRNLEEEGYENISHTREEFKKRIAEQGGVKGFESVWMKKNGDIIYVRENARIISEREGIKYYEGTVEDISQLKKTEIELKNSESLITSIIDSLSCHLAVIDHSGEIIMVNQAWERFAAENNAKTNVSVGANYLKVCENSDLQDAKTAMNGILQVLDGKPEEFSMEYSCHSPDKKRWFMMTVKPLTDRKGASICHIDISENIQFMEKLEDALSELSKSESRLRDAQKLAHVGSYSFNLDSKRAEWSEELYSIFERDKNLNAPDDEEFLMYLHPDDQENLRQTGKESIEKKAETYRIELRALFDQGKRVKYIETHGRIFYDKNGRPVKYFGTMADITERKLSELRIDNMMRHLKRSNEELEQFAYIASHDLQEPLRMISSYINVIKRYNAGGLDSDTERYFGFVQEGAERMKELISGLLEYSRVSTMPKELKNVDLNEVLRSVKSDYSLAIENAKAKIEVTELPVVIADEVQMRQLFQNLIANAIKFKGYNDPEIKICSVREKTAWKVSIIDNGIGIEKKDQERVFKIFQRLHDRSTYPGTGIGLSVCKKILERHNGRIWIESELGKGTAFHFTIPIR